MYSIMDASTNWLLLAFVLLVIALALLVGRARTSAAFRGMEKVARVMVLGAPAARNFGASPRGRIGAIGLIEPLVNFDPTSNFDSVPFDATDSPDAPNVPNLPNLPDTIDPNRYKLAGPRQLSRQSFPYRPYTCGRAAFDAEITSYLRALKAADEYLRPDWPMALNASADADNSASAVASAPGAPTAAEVGRAAEVRRRVMHRLRVLPALPHRGRLPT
jgi:hypothetical protein